MAAMTTPILNTAAEISTTCRLLVFYMPAPRGGCPALPLLLLVLLHLNMSRCEESFEEFESSEEVALSARAVAACCTRWGSL